MDDRHTSPDPTNSNGTRATGGQPSPRNIRNSVKEAVDKWLLNEDKDMDVRLGMTASMLDEVFNDANLPIHYGPLCLQIQTALETLLNGVRKS